MVKYRIISAFLFAFLLLVSAGVVRAEFDGYPVVLVPGMLASFDKKLMYQDIEDNKWGFVWGGNVYKALIKQLKKDGYEEGKTLFVAYYDWRKPVSENWNKYLKAKIDEAKDKSGKEKVDLLAHSMGGLLSRAYIENDEYENDVNRVILMGTPSKGASEAYIAWEGGEYPQSWNAIYKGFFNNLIRHLKKTRNMPNVKPPLAFREFVPSLKDLLPTVDFAKRNGEMVSVNDMETKNEFLRDLNDKVDLFKDRTKEIRTYSGLTGKTMSLITLGDKKDENFSLERWRDGHPNPDPPTAESEEGDETVLLTSSAIDEIENYTYDGTSHTKIPDSARYSVAGFFNPPVLSGFSWKKMIGNLKEGIASPYLLKQIMARKDLKFFNIARAEDEEEPPPPDPDEYVEPESMLSFTVSPNVDFVVTDPDGKILSRIINELGEDNANFDDDPEDDEDVILVTIKNPKKGKYVLTIKGNSAGNYYVDTTYATEDDVFEDDATGKVTEGGIKIIDANVSDGGVGFDNNDTGGGVAENVGETKKNQSSGSENKKKGDNGSVLGTTTVRVKLSEVVAGVRKRVACLGSTQRCSPTAQFKKLLPPLSEMYARARIYEELVARKKHGEAKIMLQKIREDYFDFANKVDAVLRSGKLDKTTANLLMGLRQKLEKTVMK